MIHHRTKKQVRLFDIFKLIITVILLLIILYTWRSCSNPIPEETSTEPVTPQVIVEAEQAPPTPSPTSPPTTQPEETATSTPQPNPTETSTPPVSEVSPVTPPSLTMPAGTVSPGEITLSGTGDPGSELEMVANGQVIGTATVDGDGKWQTEVELPDAGEYEIQVRTVDSEGSALAESHLASLTVETPAEETTIEIEIITPTLIMPAEVVSPGEVTLKGTGDPGSKVEVVADGQVVGAVTVGNDGNWQAAVELPEVGEYNLQVRAVDRGGKVLAESLMEKLNLTEATTLVATPTTATDQAQATTGTEGVNDQVYVVQVDDWLSKLADKFYGDMFAYPAIVTATNNKAAEDNSFMIITDPNVIEVGQKLWIPASP